LAVVMTMRQAGMRRLKKEATMDALTQISNRLGFDQQLDRFLAEHEGASFTLAMIDVDDFKLFNDLYGHQVGDQVLKQVARGLEEAVAGRGLVGRTGGDEFMLALLGLDAAASQPVIQQILTAEHQIVYQGQRINYSLSIGYADSPKHGRQLSSLVRRADEALYEVKLSGKSGAQYYSGENSRPLRAQLGFTLHDIAANIPAALLIYRPENGRILFVNQGTLRLLGYDNLWDFFGKVNTRAIHVVAPADLDRVKVWLDRFTAEAAVGDIHKLNYRVVTQDGKEVAVKANFSMVDNPHYGKLVYQTLTTA
ncbi:diguanylate cyclase domain-containing protein, partial [Lactobacillus nasalidis]